MADAEIIQFPQPSTTCGTCGYRTKDGTFCWKHQREVPDNYVCDYWKSRGTLWEPDSNEEGD